MEERRIGLGDIELSVAEAGVGQRPLLLLHGFTGAKEDFTEWLDRLADAGWHAVAPDHRGHGSSSKPTSEEAYSFEILADDVERLTEYLDWPRFTLLGHSMGGMVAQLVAIREPERLDALVMMDTGTDRSKVSIRSWSTPRWGSFEPGASGYWPSCWRVATVLSILLHTGVWSNVGPATPSSRSASSGPRRRPCMPPWHRRSWARMTDWPSSGHCRPRCPRW
jgi:pimeloyl-ACP methyl ester carboxylesterase